MSIYANILELINTYVFGGSIVSGSYEELVSIILATAAVVFLVALPFTVVWKFIKLIMGG